MTEKNLTITLNDDSRYDTLSFEKVEQEYLVELTDVYAVVQRLVLSQEQADELVKFLSKKKKK